MPEREHDSSEYFAQEFRDFLQGKGKYSDSVYGIGGEYRAEQHGNSVDFHMFQDRYHLTFEVRGETTQAHLSRLDGSTFVPVKTVSVKPKRSKNGRLSGDFFKRTLVKMLFANGQN